MLHDIRINIVPVVKEERNDVELEPCEKGDKRGERLACKQPLRWFGIFLSWVTFAWHYLYLYVHDIFLYLAVMIRSLFLIIA